MQTTFLQPSKELGSMCIVLTRLTFRWLRPNDYGSFLKSSHSTIDWENCSQAQLLWTVFVVSIFFPIWLPWHEIAMLNVVFQRQALSTLRFVMMQLPLVALDLPACCCWKKTSYCSSRLCPAHSWPVFCFLSLFSLLFKLEVPVLWPPETRETTRRPEREAEPGLWEPTWKRKNANPPSQQHHQLDRATKETTKNVEFVYFELSSKIFQPRSSALRQHSWPKQQISGQY